MAEIYLNYSNKLTNQLQFKGAGSNKVRNYNLTGYTKIKLEFYQDNKLITSFSSDSHSGIAVEDAVNGIVSYTPQPDDFQGITTRGVNFISWVIYNAQNTNGLKFGKPNLPVRIIE